MRPAVCDVVALARHELDANVEWLRREADPATAERFAKAALRTFARLAETPGIGSPFPTTVPRLEKMRKWRVEGFPRTLIFYHAIDNGIRITRVLHASQNWVAMIESP